MPACDTLDDDALPLVLQTELGGPHTDSCRLLDGLPILHPTYVRIATDGSPETVEQAQRLGLGILRELKTLGASVKDLDRRCRGAIADFDFCRVKRFLGLRRLLILVGSAGGRLPATDAYEAWLEDDGLTNVMPVFATGAHPTSILQPGFRKFNSVFYSVDIEEAVPAALSAAGVTTDENRLFISYRQKDALALADQLFEALSKHGFEVFVDRFRVKPGIDFQRRLMAELSDKSTLLVLESAGYGQSEWTRYEISFATKHRLGLIAVSFPNAAKVDGIGIRLTLDSTDFRNRSRRLKAEPLARIIRQIKLEHGRQLVWRRQLLREAMRNALLNVGLPSPRFDSWGRLRVLAAEPNAREYIIGLTPRPPQLGDFHELFGVAANGKGIVVGPICTQEPNYRARLDWLSGVSQLDCWDESNLLELAQSIHADRL